MPENIRKFLRLIRIYNFKLLLGLPKTIYFNFKYFGIKGVRLPVILSRRIILKSCKGKIQFRTVAKTGTILLGFSSVNSSHGKEYSLWNVRGSVIFGGNAEFGVGTKIDVGSSGLLEIDSGFILTSNSTISCYRNIRFGKNCLLSWDILIMDTDSHSVYDYNRQVLNPDSEIVFGDNVWIGCQCLILKGSFIPDGCIIGAKSLVLTKFQKNNCLIAGSPAEEKRVSVSWRDLINYNNEN